jgi:outer membrane protein
MKKIIYIFLLSSIGSSLMAQSGLSSLQYSMGFGAGDLHEYITRASFRGFTYNYSKFVTSNVTVGFELGWNTFYEDLPFDTYNSEKIPNLVYSAKQWRYSNHLPMLATFGYSGNTNATVTPFGSLGIGTMYTERRTDMGQYAFTNDVWNFVLKPEVGIIYNIDEMIGFTVSSKYYYGFKTANLDPQSYFTVNVGFVFKM